MPEKIDWYERRHELEEGQVFRLDDAEDGGVIKLDRRVPGDGTDWYAAVWIAGRPDCPGYEKGHFSYEDCRIHPSDLAARLSSDFAG